MISQVRYHVACDGSIAAGGKTHETGLATPGWLGRTTCDGRLFHR